MASGANGDSDDECLNSKIRLQRSENIRVYTRKPRKKSQNSCCDSDTATTAKYPVAVIQNTDNQSAIPVSIEVPSSAIPTSPGAVVLTVPTSRERSHSCSPGATKSCPLVGNVVFRECEDAIGIEYVSSSRNGLPGQSTIEKSSSQTSEEKVKDSPFLKQSHQLVELLRHQDPTPASCGDKVSDQNGEREGDACQNLELQRLKRLSPLLNDDDVCSPKATNSYQRDDKQLQLIGQSSLSNIDNLENSQNSPLLDQNTLQADENFVAAPPSATVGHEISDVNGMVEPLITTRVDDRIIFCLSKATQKCDIKELRHKLTCELDEVRGLLNQLEVKEHHLASAMAQNSISSLKNMNSGVDDCDVGGYFHTQSDMPNVVEKKELMSINSYVGGLVHKERSPMRFSRVNSDMGAARTLEPRPYSRQLSVAVMENTHDSGEVVDKEKRTPKANQFYRNSDFLLGKDRLPSESNKKLKKVNGRKHGNRAEQVHGFGFGFDKNSNQVFKSCTSLLQRLMKHKHSWVFNEPVDAKALGLHDYHVIIKHPMDLGTIKTRLSQNWYKSPREFAEDVRRVFHNAMTYNPKGQDVHIMAEELSDIFEEKWAVIETKYNPYLKYHVYQDSGFPTPTSRKFLPQPHAAPISGLVSTPGSVHTVTDVAAPTDALATSTPAMQNLNRVQTSMVPVAIDSKIQRPHVVRTPVPKKPKAKDPNKRDMTYEEKQRLSTNLQSLAAEKLDAIVQIIKKNDTALSQHDDEIEVDIDSVDPETLWELDRFVTNYKKGLSKNKRKAELALQARTVSNQSVLLLNAAPALLEVQSKSETVIDKSGSPPAVEGEKHDNNVSRSSSSSSSSSESGSSSSDSDSDADGSGAG